MHAPQLYLWPNRALVVGVSSDSHMHAHFALQMSYGLNLETAIDRCFLQKDVDFVEKIGEKAVTYLVNALHAQLLVSQLPSVVAPPSSMEAASVKWGFQTTPLSAHVTDCPYLDNLLPLRLARKPVNCLLGHVQPPFLGSSSALF